MTVEERVAVLEARASTQSAVLADVRSMVTELQAALDRIEQSIAVVRAECLR